MYTCRVCLRSNLRKFKSLFENFKNSTISLYITSLVQFTISTDDNLPDKICLPCFKQLQIAVDFKDKCESSHATLLSTLTIKKEEKTLKHEEWLKLEPQEQLDVEYLEDNHDLIYSDDLQNNSEEIIADSCFLELETAKSRPPSTEILELRASRAIDLKLECHDCGEIFKSKCKLKVHWNRVHLPEALVCTVCKKKCGNYRSLNSHRKTKLCAILGKAKVDVQGKKREFQCTECPFKTKFIRNWKRHYNNHRGVRLYVCGICGKSYSQYGTLQAHKESGHKLFEAEGTCYICGKFIKGKTQMRNHISRHRLKPLKCEICGKLLTHKTTLADHMAQHSNIKPYTCELCAHTTHTLRSLINHKRNRHFKNNYWFNCDLCEYKCNANVRLKRHRNRHTATNIPCTVCGRFYECKKQLKKHQLTHFGERNFVCNFCNKSYLTQEALGKHIRDIHKIKIGDPSVQLLRRNNKLERDRLKEKNTNINISAVTIESKNNSIDTVDSE